MCVYHRWIVRSLFAPDEILVTWSNISPRLSCHGRSRIRIKFYYIQRFDVYINIYYVNICLMAVYTLLLGIIAHGRSAPVISNSRLPYFPFFPLSLSLGLPSSSFAGVDRYDLIYSQLYSMLAATTFTSWIIGEHATYIFLHIYTHHLCWLLNDNILHK